uniref:DUF4349 domain-containing protein n=1 Tax=Acetatifactor sp. TaxID=1872090 RepID=UPI0040578ED8
MKKGKELQKKKLTVLCLAGYMIAALVGCGSADMYTSNTVADSAAPEAEHYYATEDVGGSYLMNDVAAEEYAVESGGTETAVNDSAANVQSDRKLIRTVDLSVETKEFDLVLSTLEQQVNALGGYIENMDTYNGSNYSYYRSTRNASMTIRIPKDKMNGFLETISGICNVVRRSENVEDVTLAYVDLESHKNALSIEQTRLLALLEKAESLEDILIIEQRLSEVRYELESMESQLRTYDNKVDYGTVYLYVDEVEELTPVEEETTWERMLNGFKESIQDIVDGFVEFGIWFVVHIPYLVIWAIIIVIVVVVIKKFRKKRRDRKTLKQAQKTVPTAEGQNPSDN